MRQSAMSVCGVVMLLVICMVCLPAEALREGDKATWSKTTSKGPDAQVPGWYINLGVTGARAKIPDDQPKVLEVMFVFKNTPAAGALKVGDKIIGVNGRRFATAHKFGYGVDKFGYEGPMMDFGNALEVSQGKVLNGKLTVEVMRDGKSKRIRLKLPTKYGQYSKTYPYNCPKSDRVLQELYAYLISKQRSNGLWSGRPHINAFATLALMGSRQRKYMPAVKKAVQEMARSTTSKISYGGLLSWRYGLYGTVLSEYYLLTGEKWVPRELQEINEWLFKAQAPNGGWGHRPHRPPPGTNGYGPICVITMQCKMAWALMQRCKLNVNAKRFEATHAFVVKGTNRIGYVWYKDGGANRSKYADMGRTGAAALAHYLSPNGGKKYHDYAKLSAQCIGNNPKTFPDTHASPLLGMAWTALGAAIDPPSFRKLMDHNRWSLSLAHCPDGTFYYQPNRDNNRQDYSAGPRLSASATTALILSLKNRALQMTGAKLSGTEVIAATVKAITKAEKTGKYDKAWQGCKTLDEMVYEDTPQYPFYIQAVKRLEKIGTTLAAELAAKKPKANLRELRTFAEAWDGCKGLGAVNKQINAYGQQHLDKLLASKSHGPQSLNKFIEQWSDYPIAKTAQKALADKGEKELTALTSNTRKPSLLKLQAFERLWSGTPAAEKAKSLANEFALTDLELILKLKPNATMYTGFLKRWKGYDVCEQAIEKFNEKAKPLLEKVDTGKDPDRALKLKRFATSWAPLPVAKEAQKRRNAVASKILTAITALKPNKTKYYRLRSFLRIYADTSSANKARTAMKKITKTLKTRN
ncbi:MAG: hypothetical protein GY794_03895 [bacterium]|nr:hypothetical protein [bacterium]